jgi:hypothetical protein
MGHHTSQEEAASMISHSTKLSGLYPCMASECAEKFVKAPPKPFWRHDSLSGSNNHMHKSTAEREDFPCDVHKAFKY